MRRNPFETRAEIQSLQDAGCTRDVVRRFMTLWESASRETQRRFLRRYRRFLLDGIHIEQKKLNRLDYRIYHLKKHRTGGDVEKDAKFP